MSKLPTLAELYSENLEQAAKLEGFTLLLNQQPKPEWVKIHPFISGYRYLPADKVEYLLRAIFKEFKIEITGQGTAFNGVWVTVRVNYKNPITTEWMYHDGIGAAQLQTAKGKSCADLGAINNGALSMAYPIAKTVAIKDACDHFGRLFGSDLNRKDVVEYVQDNTLLPPQLDTDYIAEVSRIIAECTTVADIGKVLKQSDPAYLDVLRPKATQRKTQLLAVAS